MLEANAFYSPQQSWGAHFAKAYVSVKTVGDLSG